MDSFFFVEWDSDSFSWRATGRTAGEALATARALWERHVEQYKAHGVAVLPWPRAVEEYEIEVREVQLGAGYRDGERLVAVTGKRMRKGSS